MPAPTTYPTRSEDFVLQPPLLDLPPAEGGQSPLKERFEAFHAANPDVYEALRSLALMMQARGFTLWSIKAAYEIARWQFPLRTRGENYKLCNSFHAFYARLLMEREPRLRGFFVLRQGRQGG